MTSGDYNECLEFAMLHRHNAADCTDAQCDAPRYNSSGNGTAAIIKAKAKAEGPSQDERADQGVSSQDDEPVPS